MAIFRRCCCCVNLSVGGVMTGVMTLALSLFSIIPMAIMLANRIFLSQVITHLVDEYSGDGEDKPGSRINSVDFWGTVSQAFDSNTRELPPEDSEDVAWLAYAMLIFFVVCLILLVVYGLASALLIYGSVKRKRWLLLPWILCTLAFLLAYLAGMALSLGLLGFQLVIVVLFFVAVIEVAVAIYIWLCVISLFQAMAEDSHETSIKPRFSTTYKSVPATEV